MPIIDTEQLRAREIRPGWSGRFVHSDHLTLAYYVVGAGASIHEHSHPEEEVWNVVEGELEMTIGGETKIVGPGWVGVVPADTPHSIRVLAASRVIIVDHPARCVIGGVNIR